MLEDFEAARIDEKLKATLRFLKKMTLEPGALTPDDARAVLATGVDKAALIDAIHVAYLFNIYDRLADSMGWHVPDREQGYYRRAARRMVTNGYHR